MGAGVAPCGLGARDTLRLEAALPLYGNDIDNGTNPWEAGLGFAITLDDGADFAGRAALVAAREAGVTRRLACLRATGRGVMRPGYPVLHRGKTVARVSSGGFSPMLSVSIGLGYLPAQFLSAKTNLREDAYGCTGENRWRFVDELVEAVRAALDGGLALTTRLSADEKVDGGDKEGGVSCGKRENYSAKKT